MNETNDVHFTQFQDEASHWLRQFSLGDWCVIFAHDKTPEDTYAATQACVEARHVKMVLGTHWPDEVEPTEFEVRRTAFHEVVEVLLFPLREFMVNAFTDGRITGDVHAAIQRIENVVWEWPREE